MVPDAIAVPVSPSSVVTELCDASSGCLDWELAKAGLDSYAGRDEVRRFTSESVPAFKKKNDAAHTTAKFVFITEAFDRARRRKKFCLRYILKYSTRRGSNIFQFFDTSEKKHLVANRGRWLEHQREREGGYAGKVAK